MIKELEVLSEKVKALGEISFLNDGASEKVVEDSCVEYLRVLGYKVVKKEISYKVNTLNELIDLFYNLLEFHHNDVCSLVSNRKKDRSVLSNFINNRQQELGCSYKDSLQDCANIINIMFVYEDDLEQY